MSMTVFDLRGSGGLDGSDKANGFLGTGGGPFLGPVVEPLVDRETGESPGPSDCGIPLRGRTGR